jgi:hypothetical protein
MYNMTPAAKDNMWPRVALDGTPIIITISPPKTAATPLTVVRMMAVHGCFSFSANTSLAFVRFPLPE